MIVYAWSLVFPYLLVLALVLAAAARLGVDLRGRRQRIALSVAALAILLLPPRWIPLGRWIVGANANFSIPLTALMFAHVWERLGFECVLGRRPFDDRERLAAWVFGLAAGAALYPMALGLGGFDPYALGWAFSWLHAALLAVTAALLYARNRFGVVLVAAILAHDVGLLESPNLWDCLVDPFYAVASAAALARGLIRIARRSQGEAGTSGAAGRVESDG